MDFQGQEKVLEVLVVQFFVQGLSPRLGRLARPAPDGFGHISHVLIHMEAGHDLDRAGGAPPAIQDAC